MRSLLVCLAFLIIAGKSSAQDLSKYEKNWFIQSGDTLPSRILLPLDYDTAKQYPLVIFLHGRGESGTDNEKQLTHGARLFIQDSIRRLYPAIVVFPQCRADKYWSNVQTIADKTGRRSFYFVPDGEPSLPMRLLMSLTEFMTREYPVAQKQVYLMGLSMGGMGVFELANRKPDVFAAAVPICGGAHPATAARVSKIKWWVFHGAKDDVVLPRFSTQMVQALQEKRAKVKYTLYPEANHNSWDNAFAEPDLMKWLFSQRK